MNLGKTDYSLKLVCFALHNGILPVEHIELERLNRMAKNSQISEEKIREAISKSGYLDEQKVIAEFDEHGFFAGANFTFEDQDEHKSREIDFIATRYTEFGKTAFCFFAYGEVKKRRNPLVFFERKRQKREFLEVFIPLVATQEFFLNIDLQLHIKKILKVSEIHHQAKQDFISTQFCEIDNRKAAHKNFYETLFVPLLKCVDSQILSLQKNTPYFSPRDPRYLLNVLQPILVISGPLYAYDVRNDSLTKKNYILYMRHYDSKTVNRTLLIDIVAKDYLPRYISEKLIKTYQAIETSLKEQMTQIIEYCFKDRVIHDKKINEMMKKQGYEV